MASQRKINFDQNTLFFLFQNPPKSPPKSPTKLPQRTPSSSPPLEASPMTNVSSDTELNNEMEFILNENPEPIRKRRKITTTIEELDAEADDDKAEDKDFVDEFVKCDIQNRRRSARLKLNQ